MVAQLTDGIGGEGEGGGAKSYDGEKAWSSINRSILSALTESVHDYCLLIGAPLRHVSGLNLI
jgi:hypothetical protein